MRAAHVPLPLFLERGWPYLLREPVRNNLMLTVAQGHRDGTMRRTDDDRWWLVTADDGTVHGAGIHAGPGLLLAGSTREVAEALADAQAGPVPQVTGTDDLAGRSR